MSTTFRDRYLRSKYIVQKTIHDYSEKPALRAYLEIFLTLITVSLFGIFAIRPTLITIGRLLQEIKAKESTLTVMNDKVSDLLVAKDLYNREEDKINLIDEAVPKSPKPDNLALQIEELTKKDGVLINNLTIEELKKFAENEIDREWVEKVSSLAAEVTKNMEEYQFNQVSEKLYEFVWHEFADKYIENVKLRIDPNSYLILTSLYLILLKLLHPIMPFVTEEIYGKFSDKPLIIENWPNRD